MLKHESITATRRLRNNHSQKTIRFEVSPYAALTRCSPYISSGDSLVVAYGPKLITKRRSQMLETAIADLHIRAFADPPHQTTYSRLMFQAPVNTREHTKRKNPRKAGKGK